MESEAETLDVFLDKIEKIRDAFKEEEEIHFSMVEKLKELGMSETYLKKQKAGPKVLKTRDLIKNDTITQRNFSCNSPRPSRFPGRH